MPATRIVMPKTAAIGQLIEIKTLINHVMEPGYRHDSVGRAIPRDIITRFTCTYAGEVVFAMDLFTGVAANPLAVFSLVATQTSDLVFAWTDEHGATHTERVHLVVT